MKCQLNYEWWNQDDKEIDVDTDHYDDLQEHSNEHIPAQIAEGYTSGQLLLEVDGTNYQGWWEITTP